MQQLTATDCGAACLATVLTYWGKRVRLDEEVREAVGTGRDGASADQLLRAARWFGLRGRGVRVDLEELEFLEPGTVLHWQLNHFVVFERLRRGSVDIIDPAFGHRRLSLEEFGKAFTGVALLLEPGDMFEPENGAARPLPRMLRQLLWRSGLWARIALMSILLLFSLGLPILTGLVVDRIVPRSEWHLLTVLGAGVTVMIVFQFLSSMIRGRLLLHMRTQLDARMTLDFVEHLLALPNAFFQRRSSGDLLMRMNSNTVIREILTSGALSTLLDGSLVALYLVIIVAASRALALLVLLLATTQLGIYFASRGRQRRLMSQSLVTQVRAQSNQVEMLAGIETLKAMGAEQLATEHWANLFVDDLNVSLQRGALDATIESLTSAFKVAAPLVILVWGAVAVLHGELSLGAMLGLNALALGFLTPVAGLTTALGRLQLLGSYLERIDDVLSTPREQTSARALHTSRLRGRIALLASATRRRRRWWFGTCRSSSSPACSSRSSARAARANRRWPACCSVSTRPHRDASSTMASICTRLICGRFGDSSASSRSGRTC